MTTAESIHPLRTGIAADVAAHVLMLAVMVLAMWPGATAGTRLAGAAVLVVVAIAVAPGSRRRRRLRPLLLDLWVMILLLVLHPVAVTAAEEHHVAWAGWEAGAAIVVTAAWAIARLAITRDRHAAITAAVTAGQVVVMLAVMVAR